MKETVTVIPDTASHYHIRRSPGNVEYISNIGIHVDLTGILQNRLDEYFSVVQQVSKTGRVLCSETTLPFVIRNKSAFDVAHGVEHLAQPYEQRLFSGGQARTNERSRRSTDLEGEFWIELHLFHPKWWVLFPEHQMQGFVMSAVEKANEILRKE